MDRPTPRDLRWRHPEMLIGCAQAPTRLESRRIRVTCGRCSRRCRDVQAVVLSRWGML